MYQEILKKTPASQHSSVIYPSASSQRKPHKPPDYSSSEYDGAKCAAVNVPPPGIQVTPKTGTMLHNSSLTKHDNPMNSPKKVSQKPEFGLKPFTEVKNVDKNKVMEILPKPKAMTEPPALNIRSGISPLVYCRQSSVGKSSTYTSHSDKSDSLENKVKSTSIIVSQRNCIVQKRREERQSFEDMLTEVEEKCAQSIVKKRFKRSISHSIKSEGFSELVTTSENANQQNLETGKTSKQEKHSDMYKLGKHQSFKNESVRIKHIKSEHVRTLENRGKNELSKRTGNLTAESSFEVNQKSNHQEQKHDPKLSPSIKATGDNSDQRKHSISSDELINVKMTDKVSVKHVLKAPPMDYHNLYLYCIKKSYRLKHVNWNCSSQTLLRMLKKKYKSLKLMFNQEPVLYLERCAANKLYKNRLKGASVKGLAMNSKEPAEKESEMDSTIDDDQQEGSLVDPRVMSLSKTLVSSDSGKVGVDKIFKKYTPSASGKNSQKSKAQFNKKISKPDWTKLREKLKAISSKPVKKKPDGLVVEKNLTKMPLQFGNLIFNQVPQFRIPLKSNSKSKEEEHDFKQAAEPGCEYDSDATICESDEEPADNDNADTTGVYNELSTLSNEVESNLLKSSSEHKCLDENIDGLPCAAKPDGTHDNATLVEFAKVCKPSSDDKMHENIFDIVSYKTLQDNSISDGLTEACDVIPDLYAEKHEMMIIDDIACDTSPPILEKAIDTSTSIENEESNIQESDNEMNFFYKNGSKTIREDSEDCKHASEVDHQEVLQEQAFNTEQGPIYSNSVSTEYPDSGDVEVPIEMHNSENADNEDCLNLVIGNVRSLQSNILDSVNDSDIDSEKSRDHVADSKDVKDLSGSQLGTCTTFSPKKDCEDKVSELRTKSDKRLVPLVDYICDSDTSDEDEAADKDDIAHKPDISVDSVIGITDQKQIVCINQNKITSEEVASNSNSPSKQHQNCLECISENYAESENKEDNTESKVDNQCESEVVNDYITSSSGSRMIEIAVSENDSSISVELSNECHHNDEGKEDDSVDMDCHEDDKSELNNYANEENIGTEEPRSNETIDNLSDDLDDSCSLPDIEPPTVQFIEHKDQPNLTTPSKEIVDPPNVTSQTNKTFSGDTKMKSVPKLETTDGKTERMEFNEERLMCDFPNHNWLFNKYNINVPENSDEQVQRRPKKRRKESLKHEKLDRTDDDIRTPQRTGRTNCTLDSRLSNCLQGFKCDKSNVETNVKFGWNKKNSKRQINAFKGFQNKANSINNVFEVDGIDPKEHVSDDDKLEMPQTKLLKKVAGSNINACKTFKSDLQGTKRHDQPGVAINLCTKDEHKFSVLKTDFEDNHPVDQSLVVQKQDMPLDLTFDHKLDKNRSVNVEEHKMEGADSVNENFTNDRCSDTINIAEIRKDVQNILEELSDDVVKTFERNTEHGQSQSGIEINTKHESSVYKKSTATSDLSIRNDDDDAVIDEDDEESRLEIDESVDDLALNQDERTNDVNEVTETTQSSDSFSSSVTISSSASSAISVTIATDTSTPETKQEVNQKEDRHTLLDISTSKAESIEVNFRPRSKPPVQLVHPQVHKPLSDSDFDRLPSLQEVHSQHNTVFQGTEVQSTRSVQTSWTSSDDASSITTKVSSGGQLCITPSLTSINPNQIACTRAFASAPLQDGHLSNRKTDSSTVLSTSVTTFGGGLVIPVQPFVQNVKDKTSQNVQNNNVHEHGTPLTIVQQSDSQSFLPNYADKSLNSSTNSGANHGHMLITQSSSLPLQRGLNSRPPPLLILPKSQVPPLQASKQAKLDDIMPAGTNASINALSAPQVPYNSSAKTGTCALTVMNDRQLFIPSTSIMNDNNSSSTKDIPDDLNQAGNLGESCVEDEIKKQMEELDAEIKRKEREQEEIRRKKLELLEKMKQAKLANKLKNVTERSSSSDQKLKLDKYGPEEAGVKLEIVDSHVEIDRKRKHSGNVKDEDISGGKSCKDVVLASVSKDACSSEDMCLQNATMEVPPSNLRSKPHDVPNDELSVTVTDGVISITDNRIKEDIIPALSVEDSVLDLALSTNISVTDSGIDLENEAENCAVSANNEVPDDVETSKGVEFIEDIGVVNPFTGEYDETMKMETENEDQLDLSMKTNTDQKLNENVQTVDKNDFTNNESRKPPLKDDKNKLTNESQETVNEDSLSDSHDSGIKSDNIVKIYSDVSNSDTALNLVKVVRQSSVSNEGVCSKSNPGNKSSISPSTSTENSIFLTHTSFSSMTSSDPISTSSDIISKSSELSLASYCNLEISPSVLSTTSSEAQASEVMTVSTTTVGSLPQMSLKDSNVFAEESTDLPNPGSESDVENTHKLIASKSRDNCVVNTCSDEPLNLMCKTSISTGESHLPKSDNVENNLSGVGNVGLKPALSETTEKEVEDLSVHSHEPSILPLNECKDKSVVTIPALSLVSEKAPIQEVAQTDQVHTVDTIKPIDSNFVMPSSTKVMYIQDKPVCVQNVNGAMRLTAQINTVPERHSRSRERQRRYKSKLVEITEAHVKSPPRKVRITKPEPAHVQVSMPKERIKKMNKVYNIPPSIRQSSPYIPRKVPNYLSPHECLKPLPKPWETRAPKPAHMRRPFGIAGHLIVSTSRRRKRTFSGEHVSSPKFYSLPSTPTTPPSMPPRVSSASRASDIPGSYQETNRSNKLSSPDKCYDYQGPIRAHCRPRSSMNKEYFYETSVLRPPSIHKKGDVSVDKSDIIDLTSDVTLLKDSVERSVNNSLVTEQAIQDELNHAMSKRQRLDSEEINNRSQPRNENRTDDNRIDPEIIKKTFVKPPPPYTGRQRMPVLAQFPRRPPFDQPRVANKRLPYNQVYVCENQAPGAPRMQFIPRGMEVPRVQNPVHTRATVNSMAQKQRWSQSPPYRRVPVDANFPPRPAMQEIHSPEFTAQGHGIRQAPVASPSHHEYGPNHAPDSAMMNTHVQPVQRQSGYPNVTMIQGQQVRLIPQSAVDTRLQQHGVTSPLGYPPRSPQHCVTSPLGYPPRSPQHGVTSPLGYPPRSPQHVVISPPGYPPRSQHSGISPSGYSPDSPVTVPAADVPHVYPGNNIQSAQHPSNRHSSMITQQHTSGHQLQLAGPGNPNTSYPSQVHQLLQKQSVSHQGMTNRGDPNQQMYPQMVPGSRSPHMITRGEAATHVSSRIPQQTAPRGFVAQDHPREMSKGQLYPAPGQTQYSAANRGSSQVPMSGDRNPQMTARDDPGQVMMPGQNPALTNVDLVARSNQQSVGPYHMQGNHSAAPQRIGDDQVRVPHLTEEQRQSMQRIRAQHIRTQQLQSWSPSSSVPASRYPDPVSMHVPVGGNSQANSFGNQGSQCKVQQPITQQTNTSLPILDSTSPTILRSGPSTDSIMNPKIDLQGHQETIAPANHVRGQGQVTNYAPVNNDTVFIPGSHVVQTPQNSHPTQEIPAGQMMKINQSSGNSVPGQVSPGNQIRGQVVLSPQGQGQVVQFNNTNNSSIHLKGNLVQVDPQSGHRRHLSVDVSRQDHVGGNQGQASVGFQQKSPQQSAQQRNVNITHNRPILPKPVNHGNSYVQNAASQSTVTMTTDLRIPQQTQSAPSSQHSPKASSANIQLSPQSVKNSTQSQSEGQVDGDLPHLQQVHGECFMCGKYSLYLCSNCKEIWYCSPECQLTHWETHAAECVGPSG